MNQASERPLRGLRAFMALPQEALETAAHALADSDNMSNMSNAPIADDSDNRSDRPAPGHEDSMLVTSSDAGAAGMVDLSRSSSVQLLPAPGQRWAYGARKHDMAARRIWREEERARTPLQRFEAVLAQLPTIGRGAIDLDLVEATLAASAANTVRGLLADMRGFGEACREQGVSALPAQPASVIAFLRARTDGKGGEPARPATLSRILWAIATFHRLFKLDDPTKDDLVRLEMKALRRRLGTAQRQARPLRFKGAVRDPVSEPARGVSLQAVLEGCDFDEKGARDRALLCVAYDTGLRASELVAIDVKHILPASDPHCRLLAIPRHKGDQEGEGATAFLSERSVLALQAWLNVLAKLLDGPEVSMGPVFRRLFIKRLKPVDPLASQAAARREAAARHLGLTQDIAPKRSVCNKGIDPMTVVTAGQAPMRPQAVTQIFKARVQGAWDKGLMPDISQQELAQWVKGISAHSTRIGMNNDLFAAGEDIAGIMDALRWKSPKMPLSYNRNLAAEHGAAGRLLTRLG